MSKYTKAKIGFLILFVIAAIILCLIYLGHRPKTVTQTTKKDSVPSDVNGPHYSVTDPKSLWMIVNKHIALPGTYVPSGLRAPAVKLRDKASNPEMQLRPEAAENAEKLVSAAKKDDIDLMVVSGYRSYDLQNTVYNGYVKKDGQANADKYSARPGHSEHQTGLAVDFGLINRQCELDECFGDTLAGKWLVSHAADFGFVLRYPKGKQSVVGYNYEPWHFRYVGDDLAKSAKKSNMVLEEVFGLPAAPNYN